MACGHAQQKKASELGRDDLGRAFTKNYIKALVFQWKVVLTENENGEPLSIGRKTRLVPKAIARALHARDHGCCRRTFLRPDGIAVPDCGYSAWDTVDDDDSEAYAMPPAGGLLSVAEKTASEPAAPVYWH